jgi:hypothetical protein
VYSVGIRKYRVQTEVREAEVDLEYVNVLAEDLEEALEKAKDYAELLNNSKTWGFYEIESINLTYNSVYTGVEYLSDLSAIPVSGSLTRNGNPKITVAASNPAIDTVIYSDPIATYTYPPYEEEGD